MTLSTRETGSSLSWRKERQARGYVFRALLAALGFSAPPEVRPPSLLQGPQFPSQSHVSPTLSSLANPFLGQRSTAHGEGGRELYQHHSRCHAGVTLAEGTWHLPRAPAKSGRPRPWLAKNQAESIASSGRRKQTASREAFASICWAAPVKVPLQAKNASWGPLGPGLQVDAQVVLLTERQCIADGPRLTSSLLQSRRDGKQPCEVALMFPGSVGPSWAQGPGTIATAKWPPNQGLAAGDDSPARRAAWHTSVFGGRRSQPQRWVFRPLAHSQCGASQIPDLWV